MCRGRFNGPNEQPRITASVLDPGFRVGQELSFIFDTGADSTTLSGVDAAKMGLLPDDLDELDMEYEEIAISGVSDTTGYTIREPFLLATEEHSEELDRYSLHIELLQELTVVPTLSDSLLGRDIIHRFDVSYNVENGEVVMDRRSFGEGMYACLSGEDEIADHLHEVVDREDGEAGEE